jgi:hypothetical protein
MAIPVRCISCGKVAQVRNDLAGKKVKCNCGAVISVPLPPKPRSCAGCGVDITRGKRTKDPVTDNLYCEVCWAAKLEAAKVGAASQQDNEVIYYPCYVCDMLCTAEEVYDAGAGQTVCKTCWDAGKRPAGMETTSNEMF